MATAAPQSSTLGALENLGWTALSLGAAAVLLPAIGLKALSKSVFPGAFKAPVAEERHYLIQ
ncbi:hypothetical protein NMQ03_16150 [Arthrobacter sp. DNA4]|uniref:hypothetical protein n=1 Tax=Micrococcaceae TaxID=1268 RepID=UPI0020CB7A1D|nr:MULTISPECIES: hypothetical protein [Micrococcaceae]UTT68741.1 hypothetical protein NMQ03_16150 [Arthrobacter sp. DNA4]WRT12989.1 hypothetical protein VIK36_16760 [Pseudarthrobacter sp. LT1]